ncbi:anti-sigma factor domain-containing protein [Effusibacillus consociatus]|uniref:Anti-sigma factor domain-containing protein n=1 Tax=Effusibacillus consociatus TaxID=1117041 RepID=A0ABV9Q8W0_9BACL
MREQKGVIMKLSGSHVIVMTADRQFLRIPMEEGMRIGQEVKFSEVVTKQSFGWKKIGRIAASLALALGIWQMMPLFQPDSVSAYVAIDINPSLELAVDKDREVLEATALNKDGETLLVNLKLKGKPIQQAVNELAAEAAKKGYVKSDGEILVTAANAGNYQMDIKVLENDVMMSVQETLKQNGLLTNVGGVVVSESVREEALKLGLSPGKYALYLQAKVSGIEVTVDDLKQSSVSAVAKQHGQDMKEIVQSMNGDKKLDELLAELQEKKVGIFPQEDDKKNNSDNKNHNNQKPPGLMDKDKEKAKEKEEKAKPKQDDKTKNKNDHNDHSSMQPVLPAIIKEVDKQIFKEGNGN